MPLTVTDCTVTTDQITLIYSDPISDKKKPIPEKHSALNAGNYKISVPGAASVPQPSSANSSPSSNRSVTLAFGISPVFNAGDWVTVIVHHVHGAPQTGDPQPELEDGFAMITRQVPGKGKAARLTKDVEDAIAYPILTEEVSYPPTSSRGMGGGSSSGGKAGQGLGQIATNAISSTLGWKPNSNDPKGFVGALTQSFTLTDVEGHVESTWNPRTYTVQTDLSGGISGAQASLYTRAKDAQDNCLLLLDGLYALDPTADSEYVTALREMAKSQISEIVKQFGVVPPSILRINTYFKILLGATVSFKNPQVQADPDKITGTLGSLRDIYGIYFQRKNRDNPFSNSVEDEQDITNFRVISDYMTSLLQSWLSNGKYFILSPSRLPAFLGTQLVLISRQLNVIAETVNEVRFALDSVFIGPNERQTLLLEFGEGGELPAMYLEDVLTEIESSVSDEMPRLLKDGGRIAVNNNLLPVMQTLMDMVQGAKDPENIDALPDGFSTARVRHAFDDLSDQLTQLFTLGQQIGMQPPQSVETEAEDMEIQLHHLERKRR